MRTLCLLPLAGCIFIPGPPPCQNGCVVIAEEVFEQVDPSSTDILWLIDPNAPDAIESAAAAANDYANTLYYLEVDFRLALATVGEDGPVWLGEHDSSISARQLAQQIRASLATVESTASPVDLSQSLHAITSAESWTDFHRSEVELHVQVLSDDANAPAPADALGDLDARLHVAGPSWCADNAADSWVQLARERGGSVVPTCTRRPAQFWMHAAAASAGLRTEFHLDQPPIPGTFVVQAWQGSQEIDAFEHGLTRDMDVTDEEDELCISPVACLQWGYDADTNTVYSVTSTVPPGARVIVRFYIDDERE